MFVDNSLDCVVSETTMSHSRQASLNTFPHVSLFTKNDVSDNTATAQLFLTEMF